jgi:hypothetical protein
MSPTQRSIVIRRNRPRGIYIPSQEAQPYIELLGWHVLDDCPGHDEVLLAPPSGREEAA